MIIGKATINRLRTGVPGLDEVLGGGLPEFSCNLIAGPPGCGKTTLAHQMMFALATADRPALYFTVLGEPPIKMLRYQQQYDFFDLDKLNRSIRFINLADDAATGNLEKVLARIVDEVEKHEPGMVFVDSFRSVVLAGQSEGNSYITLQHFIQNLGILMTSWQATTFLIGEYFTESDPNPIFTVADGLIWMRQSVLGDSVVRKLEIMKMRGQPSLLGRHTFRMSSAGIHVFAPPQLAVSTEPDVQSSTRARLPMGVAGLDAMMGGGLTRGYSLLVAGPSGSGKSILAAAFLAEGARQGETGVIAAFEQRPNASRGRVLAGLIESGRIGVVDTRAPGLSVDEIAKLLIDEISRLKASRVVIDSLSGFELALAPNFRSEFREALSRMVSALARTGATVLMTSELEDRYTDLRFSPYGTAFLTDAIIVQRYVELDSKLQRVMAVVKVRASAHASELRLFEIDDDGIKLGEPLMGYEGLLGGAPTRRPTAIDNPLDRKIVAATPKLALLEEEASRLRGELTVPRRTLIEETRADSAGRSAQMLEANEQLVLAALHSDHIAETAVSELFGLTNTVQRDGLTNTPNRPLMIDRMEHAIDMAQRGDMRLAVLFLDLDQFKKINDRHGHVVGDEVLKLVARRLEASVRASDTVSRFGGDEFVVLLTEILHASDAELAAVNMLAAIAAPSRVNGGTVQLSASVGIAVYPDDGIDAATLISRADQAMYRAKRQGGGGFEHAVSLPTNLPPE